MVKPWSLLTLLILLMFGMSSFAQINSNDDPIVPKTELAKWGYRTISFDSIRPTRWEIDRFGNAIMHLQKIKAVKEVHGWPNAYYRFTITRLVYQNEDSAQTRLKNIHAHPPEVSTKREPEYILRKGFRKGKTVYFVSTDVLQFEVDELPRLFKLFKSYIEKIP